MYSGHVILTQSTIYQADKPALKTLLMSIAMYCASERREVNACRVAATIALCLFSPALAGFSFPPLTPTPAFSSPVPSQQSTTPNTLRTAAYPGASRDTGSAPDWVTLRTTRRFASGDIYCVHTARLAMAVATRGVLV